MSRRTVARPTPLQPSFRRKPESIRRRRPVSGLPTTVIPAQAGIHGDVAADGGAADAPTTVIPAQAGIYLDRINRRIVGLRLQPSFRRKPESMLAGSITIVGDYDAGFRRKPE